MSATISNGDAVWVAAGWLFRFVLDAVQDADLTPAGRTTITAARLLNRLDLADLEPADRAAVAAATGPDLTTRFRSGLLPGYDPAAALERLEQLASIVG